MERFSDSHIASTRFFELSFDKYLGFLHKIRGEFYYFHNKNVFVRFNRGIKIIMAINRTLLCQRYFFKNDILKLFKLFGYLNIFVFFDLNVVIFFYNYIDCYLYKSRFPEHIADELTRAEQGPTYCRA